jgi:GDP-L-fucose synthase
LIRRFQEAVETEATSVVLWGSGTPRREFLYADDLGDALVHLLRTYADPEPINVGYGDDVTIRELAEMVADVVGYDGEIVQDTSKPDGTPRKLLDVSRLNRLGWEPTVGLREGISRTHAWFMENRTTLRLPTRRPVVTA